MSKITIGQLADIIGAGAGGSQGLIIDASNVCIDSRKITEGQIFFAIEGKNFDGHDFIDTAFNAGASCAVVGEGTDKPANKPLLKVKDTTKALGDLARWWRKEHNFKVVAITGSAGKTTTRQIIAAGLGQKFKVAQSPKSFNNNIGVPLTILAAEYDCDMIVAELGSSGHGEISNLSRIAIPDIALITNIYPAHLEGLGSIEGVIKEKASIRDGLKENGKLLVNADFGDLINHLLNDGRAFETFGSDVDCDIKAHNIRTEGAQGWLEIEGIEVKIPFAGRANLENTLAGWAVCKQFGVSPSEFAAAVANLKTEDMRLEIVSLGEMTVINDCYNANPASMQNALDCLEKISSETGKRSVFICGQMNELGDESEKLHAELGEKIAQSGVKLLLTTGDWANIAAAAAKGIANKDIAVHTFENPAELCNKLAEFVAHDDIILVKGSRDAKLETVTAKLEQICLRFCD
ncbi:MAG: UDP-N-acetylmuramoyl-tripeptide--D-alanyl-D-alanine ligase [Planctomycetes bacterium]|nr:UDP-N-acetylmuramoyl-tripeptide--D-alanyl-D-alanine ligase [Planctomycetota bacterium]